MIEVVESATFKRWVRGLRDRALVARINARLRNVSMGNFGDTKTVGSGISEMRIHHGAGYRLYFIREAVRSLRDMEDYGTAHGAVYGGRHFGPGTSVVVLLCGGDKGSQQRDIERAKRLALDWR